MPAGAASVREGSIFSSDGLRLSYRERVLPHETAHVVVVHGVAEHSGRYRGLEDLFVDHGIGVSLMDLRGHGQSDGRRVWAPSFESYLEDLDIFLSHARSHSRRVFLLGHSLGGLIALRFAETRRSELQGLIISGAALKPTIAPPAPVVWLLELLNRVSSATPIPGLVKPRQLSRDPDVIRRYVNDPLVPRHLTTGLGLATMDAARRGLADAGLVEVPTLILHGGADSVVHPDGSQELLSGLQVSDKQLRVYPGLYHEIFNEPQREDVLRDVVAWIRERAADRDLSAPGS
jgi:alpha-beta hydrolase superfamily lysophospholipase